MSLEAAIHTQWAAKTTLAALLPVDRLFTGRAPPETPLPYATLAVVSTTPALRLSGGERVLDATVRFAIKSDRFADGAEVAETLASPADGLAGASFSFSGGDALDARFRHERRSSTPDGVWTFEVELTFRVRR